jgi:hypothetical protein
MAIVATPVISGSGIVAPASPQYKSWNITALDADTTVTFPHGFVIQTAAGPVSVAPDLALLQNVVTYANAALPNWGVAVTATNITLTKTNAAGSGGAVAGTTIIAKLYAMQPHTILQ